MEWNFIFFFYLFLNPYSTLSLQHTCSILAAQDGNDSRKVAATMQQKFYVRLLQGCTATLRQLCTATLRQLFTKYISTGKTVKKNIKKVIGSGQLEHRAARMTI